jgi:hypothetical protein
MNSVIAEATQRVGLFFRGFCSCSLTLIRKILIIAYIRQIREYNSSVSNPTKNVS